MSWLKALWQLSMPSMLVTLLVSQLPMSWLKAVAYTNSQDMSVTLLVSQSQL